jgi:hypothetical protein
MVSVRVQNWTQLLRSTADLNFTDRQKSRVPDTFQLGAILPILAFLASREINKLHAFNGAEYSSSPRPQDYHS